MIITLIGVLSENEIDNYIYNGKQEQISPFINI